MTQHKPRKQEWNCYEITHAGEGERGRSVMVVDPRCISPDCAAEEAARYFDNAEMRLEDLTQCDFEGTQQVIDVVDADQSWRYRVSCEVTRQYTAAPEPAPDNRVES